MLLISQTRAQLLYTHFMYTHLWDIYENKSELYRALFEFNYAHILSTNLAITLYNTGHCPNELSVHQWSRRLGFNPRSSHTKDSKNGT